jgi:hypothetical protein
MTPAARTLTQVLDVPLMTLVDMVSRECEECGRVRRCRLVVEPSGRVGSLCRRCARELGYVERRPSVTNAVAMQRLERRTQPPPRELEPPRP